MSKRSHSYIFSSALPHGNSLLPLAVATECNAIATAFVTSDGSADCHPVRQPYTASFWEPFRASYATTICGASVAFPCREKNSNEIRLTEGFEVLFICF